MPSPRSLLSPLRRGETAKEQAEEKPTFLSHTCRSGVQKAIIGTRGTPLPLPEPPRNPCNTTLRRDRIISPRAMTSRHAPLPFPPLPVSPSPNPRSAFLVGIIALPKIQRNIRFCNVSPEKGVGRPSRNASQNFLAKGKKSVKMKSGGGQGSAGGDGVPGRRGISFFGRCLWLR